MRVNNADLTSVEGGEFTLSTVPPEATTPSYRIGLMLLAANISLPPLVMGGEMGTDMGLKATALACLWGGMILAFIAATCAYAGARSRLSTYILITDAFGQRGGGLVNAMLSLSAVGWFGVVVMLFARTMVSMVGNEMVSIWAISGAALMIATTLMGFRALNILSNIMLPLKALLMVWAVVMATKTYGIDLGGPGHGTTFVDMSSAISYVVGGWVVGAVVAPDFARFARRPIGGAIACASSLGVGYPLVLLSASIPAILTGQKDLIATMVQLGMGLAALSIVLLASWTNGASNLYSGSLMLATVFRQGRRAVLVTACGLVGLILGLAGITDWFVPYMVMLSLVVPPIAGVYLPRFLIDLRLPEARLPAKDWHPAAFVAWAAGVGVAALGNQSAYGLTGIVAIDSLLVSASVYLAFEFARRRRLRQPYAEA